jgi:plastocyanin
MSRNQRIAFAALAAVIAVVAVVVLTSGSDDSEPAATTTTPAAATATSTPDEVGTPASQEEQPEAKPAEVQIEVKGGEVVGGTQEIRVKQGEDIRFSVTSDASDEVHVHGYDVKKDVEPGEPVSFDIPAKITGIFEVELEDAGVQVASLRVEQ